MIRSQPTTALDAPAPTERSGRAPLDRYLVVTVVATPTSFALYALALAITPWSPTVANVVVASLVAIPSFIACKRWVWRSRTAVSFGKEVGPYWTSTLINIVASTLAVDLVASMGPPRLVLTVVPTAVYTLTWICRFLILDRYVFRPRHATARGDRVAAARVDSTRA
jgi:putative flippase GtrA